MKVLFLAFCALVIGSDLVAGRPYKDSPIKTIIVPYNRNVIGGTPYQYPRMLGENRHVIIPETMQMVPSFNLDKGSMTMGGHHKGLPVNFADGAYPVYYMPGNANGKFNGKISLLV